MGLYPEVAAGNSGGPMNTNVRAVLLATTAGCVVATTVQAADSPPPMPVKASPSVAIAPSWVGPYWGLHLGAARHRTTSILDTTGDYSPSFSKTRGIGGGQIGYNWQQGGLVYGFVADASILSGGKSTQPTDPPETASTRLRAMATLRGKAGVTNGDTQAYVTAGAAIAKVLAEYNYSNPSVRDEANRTGLVAGGGVERMIGGNWSAFLEALHVKFTHDATFQSGDTGKFKHRVTIVRAGVNKRF
jgi:outer membrane immunogenic protein